MDKEARKYKTALEELAGKTIIALEALDNEMEKPPSNGRGRRLATIRNFLDMANDSAMHFGLGWGFKKIENFKKKCSFKEPSEPAESTSTPTTDQEIR